MAENKPALKPANENPWYILMTLYGEQEGEEIDWDLHERNRAAWNAWSCQGMMSDVREEFAKEAGVSLAEVKSWDRQKGEIARLHKEVWVGRNGGDRPYPGLPDVADEIDMSEIAFLNPVVLNNAIFYRRANFHSAHFSGLANFDSAQFSETVLFPSAQFSGGAYFGSARFSGLAYFGAAQFSGNTYFDSARFSDFTYFKETTFGAGTGDKARAVSFSDCQLEKPLSFRGAKFRDTYPDFEGAVLHDKTAFTAETENWPQHEQADPKQARASCAVIRHALGKQGLPEEEHFFYRLEMGFAGQVGGWWERLPYRAFGWVSNYGFSIWRPCAWLGALWLVPMLVYMSYFNWDGVKERMNGIKGVSVGTFDSASLSFASMFKFLGLQRLHFGAEYIQALPPFLELLTAVQTVGGIVLLFFLGLGLRTRFRLR